MNQQKQPAIVQEMGLIDLVIKFWNKKLFIGKVTLIFAMLGLLVAFISPVEYRATTKLLPELEEGSSPNLGGLGGLAGLAGIDISSLSNGGGILSPELYPEIVYSVPFILSVMHDSVFFEKENEKVSSFEFFKENEGFSVLGFLLKYTGLKYVLSKLKDDSQSELASNEYEELRLSKEEWKIIDEIRDRISIQVLDQTGVIEIKVEMPDRVAAAQLTKKIELLLTRRIVHYKTEKAKETLGFIEDAQEQAKSDFEKVQYRLARIIDRNKNVSSESARIELQKVEQEYDLAFNLYKGLSSQLQNAKLELKENTPVFTVLEPVWVPEEKSKPRRLLILLGSSFMGLVTALCWISFPFLFPSKSS